jgi:hypothetical protein
MRLVDVEWKKNRSVLIWELFQHWQMKHRSERKDKN